MKTSAPSYRNDHYRIGFDGGARARTTASINPNVALPESQSASATQASTGVIAGSNWAQSAQRTAPTAAVAGYLGVDDAVVASTAKQSPCR